MTRREGQLDTGTEMVQISANPNGNGIGNGNMNGHGTANKKAETDLPASYLEYLDALRDAWQDLPDLHITYKDLGYSLQVPMARREIPNLYTALRDTVKRMNVFRDKSMETKEFKALQGASGIVRPGELTMILAPAGHGKSALLKSLAGRLQRESSNLRGEIRWNGLTADQSAQQGQQLAKMCAFVEQGDVHYPMLTVRETFEFALKNSNADTSTLNSEGLNAKQANKVDLMLELLGLRECADTVVGNNMMRGISGGQKKRVTLGEMMIGQARALFLDEISTGLDAAATFDIVSAIKRWCRVMRGSATMALLQPSPEVFAMADRVILLREGQIVFSGSQAELRAHFDAIHIQPNPEIDFADWIVDFLNDPPTIWKRDLENRGRQSAMRSFRQSFREELQQHSGSSGSNHLNDLTDAKAATSSLGIVKPPEFQAQLSDREPSSHEVVFHLGSDEGDDFDNPHRSTRSSAAIVPAGVEPHYAPAAVADWQLQHQLQPLQKQTPPTKKKGLGQIISARDIPLTTAALRKVYESSKVYQDLRIEVSDTAATLETKRAITAEASATAKQSLFTRAQFFQLQSWSLWRHTLACLDRQRIFMSRSPGFIRPRIGRSIFMGLVLGSLFWQLGVSEHDSSPRLGIILFALINIAFANMAEVPLASEFKLVVYKQLDAGFYSTFSYVFSVTLMHFPLALAECTLFGTILYWMSGFSPDAGRWLFFVLDILGSNLSMGAIFRTLAYTMPNANIAANLASPVTAVCLLFGGFLVTASKIPNFLIWLFWLSPFSWGLRSGALSEFNDSRYGSIQPNGETLGDTNMHDWQIDVHSQYKWAGIGYQLGVFMFFVCVSAASLKYQRVWLTRGTRRTDAELSVDDHEQPDMEVRIGAKTTSMIRDAELRIAKEDASQLTFDRMNMSWIDLKYSVPVFETNNATGKKEHYDRQLLAGISGYAKAGEMTALMGSSGAGKTTLMDVLAGRKTAGTVTGQILIDGHPQTFPTFNRLMGYCEQQDVHLGTDTVREAIEFSAKLRLPANVSDEARKKFVDQILDDLELTPIANRLIGDVNIEGLSPGQLKRVTIGVELAANPTFLFLDEPTSGLDSRAAMIVIRVIRKISRRGRAVICTIHQPSAELFAHFDRLLLLKSGGKEVYFGPVGEGGVDLVSYFMNAPIDPEFYRPQLPETANPASWMLDVIGAGTSVKGKIAAYEEVYAVSPLREENMKQVTAISQPHVDRKPASFDSPFASSYSDQFIAVQSRLFTTYWRDVGYNFSKFILMIILGVIFGLVYLKINDDDEPGIFSKLSVIYVTNGFLGVLQHSNALPVIFRLREVFYRERSSNTYAPCVYSSALAVVELPYLFICTLLFVIPLYFLVGFVNTGVLFWRYILVSYLTSIFFSYFGQMLASLTPNIQVASILQGLWVPFFFVFGGIFIQFNSIPAGWKWMFYIDPFPSAAIPLSIQQYYCNPEDPTCPVVQTLSGFKSKWEYVADFYRTGHDWEGYYIAWLVFKIVVIRILCAFIIQKVSHRRR